MVQAYRNELPAVEWNALRRSYRSGVSAREGHCACVFSTPTEERICITGGFADDPTLYLVHVPNPDVASSSSLPWTWNRLNPQGPSHFVYGSSLTTLDETRALRLGGFLSGGYSGETNDICLLTIQESGAQQEQDNNDDNSNGNENQNLIARWEVLTPQNCQYCPPRAYHTTTLLGGRYLFVVGGMTSSGSILNEAILDTKTWTWMDPSRITSASGMASQDTKPTGRHGHSLIVDHRRNRLVLFGGGSGSDLLRSGRDNAEVWELKMGPGWETNIEDSFPWTWSKVHGGPFEDDDDDETDVENVEANDSSAERRATPLLSPSEKLILGRCHRGVKIGPDTALFIFGSGKPSTNGVIGYNLREDSFLRPQIKGPLPVPRFTFVSAFLEKHGYLFVHGGFASQQGDSIGDMSVLDLAPLLKGRDFTGLPKDERARSHDAISDEDAERGQRSEEAFLFHMFESLRNAGETERQGMAAEMLGQLIANGQYGGRPFMLMNMIANGNAVLQFGGGGDDDDEESSNGSDSPYFEDTDDTMDEL